MLEVSSKRVNLFDKRRQDGMTKEQLAALNQTDYLSNTEKQNLDMIVSHEVAESGIHMLRVNVEYDGWRTGERKQLRKIYRFDVRKTRSTTSIN